MLGAQREEQVGAGGEAVVRAVVDDRRKIGAAERIALKCAFWAAITEPRDRTRGMTIRPWAPTFWAWAAWATAEAVLTAPVPTMTGMPALTRRSTPSMRCASLEERPVTHGAAVNDGRHALRDQLLALAHERVEVGVRSSLQGSSAPGSRRKNLGLHFKLLLAWRTDGDRRATSGAGPRLREQL